MSQLDNFRMSEEKATDDQKEKIKILLWAMRFETQKPINDYTSLEALDLIKTLTKQYEERKVGQVVLDKIYDILKTETEGEYLITNKESNYLIKPKVRQCECPGFKYEKHCKHLDDERFIEFWTRLGEYITTPVLVFSPFPDSSANKSLSFLGKTHGLKGIFYRWSNREDWSILYSLDI